MINYIFLSLTRPVHRGPNPRRPEAGSGAEKAPAPEGPRHQTKKKTWVVKNMPRADLPEYRQRTVWVTQVGGHPRVLLKGG